MVDPFIPQLPLKICPTRNPAIFLLELRQRMEKMTRTPRKTKETKRRRRMRKRDCKLRIPATG